MFVHTKSYRQGRGGKLYISCDPLFAEALRDHALPAFCARHPDIQLTIREENREQTLGIPYELLHGSGHLSFLPAPAGPAALSGTDPYGDGLLLCPLPLPGGMGSPGICSPGGLDPRPQLMAPGRLHPPDPARRPAAPDVRAAAPRCL